MSQLPDTAVCLHCGYALRGLPENVCPECGNEFDPDYPETFQLPGESWSIRSKRWLTSVAVPPSAASLWAVVVAGLLVILLDSAGSPEELCNPFSRDCFPFLAVILPFCAVLTVEWLFRLACCLVFRAVRRTGMKGRWSWFVLPTTLALAVAALANDWPFRLRFEISRPFLVREFELLASRGQQRSGSQWVGLFHVERLVRYPGGRLRVVVDGARQFDYDESPNAGGRYVGYSLSLGGGWYYRAWLERSCAPP